MKIPTSALIALLAVAAAGPACAAMPPQASANQQVSMTRPMIEFFQRENDLADALGKHDQVVTDRLLSADFEFRPDAHPGEATARADWLADAASATSGDIGQLGVRDFGNVAVVSFVLAGDSGRAYVIDAWKKQGNDWQLITRYQSTLPAVDAPTEDVAPTGKG